MKHLIAVFAFVLVAPACSGGNGGNGGTPPADPTPAPLDLSAEDVQEAVLKLPDVGDNWNEAEDAAPSTVQIGGRVGPANIKNPEATATTAFAEKAGSGYLTSSVYLMSTADVAQQVIAAHKGEAKRTWPQEFKDGSVSRFRNTGRIKDLPELGEESYSASLDVTVTDENGAETKRKIGYVVYRLDRLLSFVIGHASVGVYARRQERKLTTLAT